jgi:hypothetical protein
MRLLLIGFEYVARGLASKFVLLAHAAERRVWSMDLGRECV